MDAERQSRGTPNLSKVTGGLFPTAVSEEKLQEARQKAQNRIFGSSQVFHLIDEKNEQSTNILSEILQAHVNQKYKKGLHFLSQAEEEKAVIYFSKAIILDSDQMELYVKRAEAFLQLCDFQSAALNLRKACSFNSLKEEYLALLTFVLYLQGQCLFDHESYLDALDSFTRASELQPWNSAYRLRSIACLAALGRHKDCLRLIDIQLQEEKQNADLYVLRARLHDHYNQVTLCFQDVQAALALEPLHTEAQALNKKLMSQAGEAKVLAVSRALEGKLQEALQKITLAIDNQPSQAQYYLIRGAVYRRLQDFTTAIDDYLIAMELSKDKETRAQAQKQLLLTYNDFAVYCYKKGFYKEGVLLLNKALKGEKQEAGLYINRGDCFFRLGEMTFALADFQQALELKPEDQSVWTRIGMLYNELGLQEQQKKNYQQAESHFSMAIEKQTYLPQYYRNRAKVRRWLQDYRGAQQDTSIADLLESDTKQAMLVVTGLSAKSKPELTSGEVVQVDSMILNQALLSNTLLPDSSQYDVGWKEHEIQSFHSFLHRNTPQEQEEASAQTREAQDSLCHFKPSMLEDEL